MAAAIPVRMREQIVRRFERGEVGWEIAAELGVSESGARRVRQRFAERGTLEPKVGKTGPRSGLTDEVAADLRARVAADPDVTIAELLEGTGLKVDRRTLGGWLRDRLGLAPKKSRSSPASGRTARTSRRPGRPGEARRWRGWPPSGWCSSTRARPGRT